MEVLFAGHAAAGTQVSQLTAIGETPRGKPGVHSAIHLKGQREASSRNVSEGQKNICQNCSRRFLCSSASSLPFPRDGGWEEKEILKRGH